MSNEPLLLSAEEIEIVRELISDWGSDCPALCSDRLRPLAEKLGMWEPELPPTPEELARREEFRNSPMGEKISEMFRRNNEHFVKSLLEHKTDCSFTKSDEDNNYQWPIRIRFPNDYVVSDDSTLKE